MRLPLSAATMPSSSAVPSVYMALLARCDRVYVTKVDADPDADSFFPNLDDNPDWRIESESETFEENGLKFRYVDYVRK